jgi:glycosyltransferase involved in cell wall biosynthesis
MHTRSTTTPVLTESWHGPAAAGSVCLYTPSADPSGMGQHMLDLTEEYVRRGLAVTFMTGPAEPARRLLDRAVLAGAEAAPLPHVRDPAFAAAIVRRLRRRPVDVFHAHVGTGRENFDGTRAARAADVPAIVQTLHLPWQLAHPRKRVPFFRSVREVDHLITVSEGQRATYERIGVPREDMTTVPNGVRPRTLAFERLEARARLGLDPEQPVVVTVGRLNVMKGHEFLVAALPRLVAEFPDLAVVVIGGGHLRDDLEKQAAALGVTGTLRLEGHRPDARALLSAADLFTLPSRHEGMPLAALEAMDARLPVVGTRVIGTAEVVDHGRTGLLVPPRKPAPLAEAIAALLRDPDRRGRMATAARRRYLEHHTAALMASETLAVYDRLLGERVGAVS